jgi:2-methylcitrate dehydratase PrpD
MDDVHRTAILHPGPVVVPAALACALGRSTSGAEFLCAVIRGYEAMIRIGRTLGPAHYALWHPTATAGPFGAAAAAGCLLGLDDGALADALGNAGTQSSGPWQTRHEPRSMAKQLHAGRASHAGWVAAQLAGSGFAGPRAILEGPQGLWAVTCGGQARPELVLADAHAPWMIHDTSFKPWPACRHAHSAIDAALALSRRLACAPQSIRVLAYGDAIRFCDRANPASTIEAKFSLQHAVAVTLVRGAPVLADFEPQAIQDPAVAAMRARITVQCDPEIDRAYPDRYGAALVATAADGTTLRVDAPDALGDPACPLQSDAIAAKARTLMAFGGLEDRHIEALLDAVVSLPAAKDMLSLGSALERAFL